MPSTPWFSELSGAARNHLAAAAAVLTATLAGAPVSADGSQTAEMAGKRIAIARRQAVLAEDLAKTLCYLHAGYDVARATSDLYVTWNVFNWYHLGFLTGNAQLDLLPETDVDVKLRWQSVDAAWRQSEPLFAQRLEGRRLSTAEFFRALEFIDRTVARTDALSARLSTAYADSIAQGNAMAALHIGLVERSQELGERLSKLVCLAALIDGGTVDSSDLTATAGFFDISIAGFIDGLAGFNVPPAPTAEIRATLIEARQAWQAVRDVADATAAGQTPDAADLDRFRAGMESTLANLRKSVFLLIANYARS